MNHSFCSIYGSPISDAQHPRIVPSWLLRISTTFAFLPTNSSSFISDRANDGMIMISFIQYPVDGFRLGQEGTSHFSKHILALFTSSCAFSDANALYLSLQSEILT